MREASDNFAATGIMRKMNEYVRARDNQMKNNPLYRKYGTLSVEELLRRHKSPDLPEADRKFCLEAAYLKVFFFFPYFLGKRNYRLSPPLYDETLQNISQCILDAVARFDPDRGKLFLSYAYGDIMAAISKTFRDLNVVQVPAGSRERGQGIDGPTEEQPAADEELELEVDSFLEHPERGLAEAADAPAPGRDISADRVLSACSSEYADVERPTVVDYEDGVQSSELVEWLEDALSKGSGVLTDDERMVLVLHNGLFGNRPHIYTEIAKIRSGMGKGSSRSRISQIHTKALKKVRQWFADMGVEEEG